MASLRSPWLLGLATVVLASLHYRLLKLFNRPSLPLPPGPKPWPIVGNLPHLGPMPHHALADLAQIYGPLMHLRLGFVDVVVASSASVAEQFLKVHDTNFLSRPPNTGAKYVVYNYHDLVFALYGPRWRMLRKICTVHLFSGKALDDFRHLRQEFQDGLPPRKLNMKEAYSLILQRKVPLSMHLKPKLTPHVYSQSSWYGLSY